jgi:hypothetical protein
MYLIRARARGTLSILYFFVENKMNVVHVESRNTLNVPLISALKKR